MNKILSKMIICASLGGVMFTHTSCSSDYLETNPTESVGKREALSTTTNIKKVINGIAKAMTVQKAYFSGMSGENAIIRLYENLPSQNYNYNMYASGWSPLHNQTFHLRDNTIYDSYAWFYYYQIVNQANDVILNADKATGPKEEKDFYKAEALTFRSLAFEKLIHYYCYRWEDSNSGASQGLVLRLDDSTDELPASTLAQTYDQIYKDLDEAIALYQSSGMDREEGQVWMPNVNVAHAIYARAALNRHDYKKAISEAKLARQGYPLMSNADYAGGFCKPTSEWLLGSYGGSDEQNWYWAFGVQDAANGYYATTQQTGAGTIGHELISRIPNNDVRKQRFLTEDKFVDAQGKQVLQANNPKHVNQTYGLVGMDDEAIYAMADSIIKAHNVSGLTPAYAAGYYYLDGQQKFYVIDQPGVSYIPFIRSSEMLLIEAEANYFLGNTADAQAALVELNATSGRNPEYTCSKTGAALLSEIQDYRSLELWGEGFEWSDFKRWNKTQVRHSFAEGGNAHVAVAKTIKPEDGNKWTWVLPQDETQYNVSLRGEKAPEK